MKYFALFLCGFFLGTGLAEICLLKDIGHGIAMLCFSVAHGLLALWNCKLDKKISKRGK